MEPAAADFFESLSQRGHDSRVGAASGTLRFELRNGGRPQSWLVSVAKGNVSVSRGRGSADCTVRGPDKVLGRVLSGELNAMAAVLRGEVEVEGDSKLLVRFQRLFSAPEES